ncbi:GtrA family protein [Pseudomonas sp. GD03860]|uniref:GtrA family protein n=1 Tax=Pseudomonas TaxID=286 RepID=UPI0023636CA9|nr:MULTISPECIES: GtrA family protein [Pseudomonas]MDD2057764.1 GtrA family protein [Pseudomonas putida]MDH0635975.1 GtrA family protein [Pseudomonas sp. GD03860]
MLPLPQFARYTVVGIANTLVHGVVFMCLHVVAGFSQTASNFTAFLVALSFSSVVNARFTFKASLSARRYLALVLSMGSLSVGLGYLADRNDWWPLLTFLVFSLCSLVLGFMCSRYVFREVR